LPLVSQQLCILFLLGSTASVATCTTRARGSLARLCLAFRVLSVDFGDDLLDVRVRVGFDEVAEQICQAKEISESADRIIFLFV
jgi:hypothetical protein